MKDNTVRNCLIWLGVIGLGLYLLSSPSAMWKPLPNSTAQARP